MTNDEWERYVAERVSKLFDFDSNRLSDLIIRERRILHATSFREKGSFLRRRTNFRIGDHPQLTLGLNQLPPEGLETPTAAASKRFGDGPGCAGWARPAPGVGTAVLNPANESWRCGSEQTTPFPPADAPCRSGRLSPICLPSYRKRKLGTSGVAKRRWRPGSCRVSALAGRQSVSATSPQKRPGYGHDAECQPRIRLQPAPPPPPRLHQPQSVPWGAAFGQCRGQPELLGLGY